MAEFRPRAANRCRVRLDPQEHIQAAFTELCDVVDRGALVQLQEGLWTLEGHDRIWVLVGALARLLFAAAMADVDLRRAFELMVWGLARFEVRTGEDGQPMIVNAHRWGTARDRFALALEKSLQEPDVA